MKTHPPAYYRVNKEWSKWLGKKGKVIASTVVRVGSEATQSLVPYSYVLVDFGEEKRSFMGVDSEVFTAGDQVRCVLRKTQNGHSSELITYGIKVTKK